MCSKTMLPMQWQAAITELVLSSPCLPCFHYSESNHKHGAESPFHLTFKEKHMEERSKGWLGWQRERDHRLGHVPCTAARWHRDNIGFHGQRAHVPGSGAHGALPPTAQPSLLTLPTRFLLHAGRVMQETGTHLSAAWEKEQRLPQ